MPKEQVEPIIPKSKSILNLFCHPRRGYPGAERPARINEELAAGRRSLLQIESDLKGSRVSREHPLVTEARQAAPQADRQARTKEIAMLNRDLHLFPGLASTKRQALFLPLQGYAAKTADLHFSFAGLATGKKPGGSPKKS